jgi:hypothetical protein
MVDLAASRWLHWPPGYSPALADLWARGEAVVEVAPVTVLAHLATALGAHLAAGSEFAVAFEGLRLDARVTEYADGRRFAWFGLGVDISVFHGWVVTGDRGRSRVLTGLAARGAAAIELREADPLAARRVVDHRLADLRRRCG